MDWNEPTSFAVDCELALKVNIYPDTQYNVFSAEVKYIMLCMDLWRHGEYPVDKSCFMARNCVSKGFWFID
jgi:hypothetical protein